MSLSPGSDLVVIKPPDDGLPYDGSRDRNRYLVDDGAVVLCAECARQFNTEIDGDEPETDEPCQKCGAGGLVPVGEQLALM